MINGKTFYQILGVLNSTEDVVIRAAYRSLSNKYHPDKWTGDKKVAHERMSEINAAYETLGDDIKRQKYDDELKKEGRYDDAADIDNDNAEFEGIYSEPNDDWDIAIQFYPGLNSLYAQLKQINSSLAYTFKTILIEKKNFDKSSELASQLEHAFLIKYFGTDELTLSFAKILVRNNYRVAARELNRVVRLMGTSVAPDRVREVISKKYPEVFDYLEKTKENRKQRDLIEKATYSPDITVRESIGLLEGAGSTKVKLKPHWFWGTVYEFTWIDGEKQRMTHPNDLLIFIRAKVLPLYK